MARKEIDYTIAKQALVATEAQLDPLEQQYHLPLSERKKLILLGKGLRPDDDTYEMATAVARAAHVPLGGINLISSQNGIVPYINSFGVKYRLATDPRRIKSNTFEVLNIPVKNGDVAIIRRTIVMGNEQVYQGIGAVIVDSNWKLDNALLKADTKAARRAGYDAIADSIGLPEYDDDNPNLNGGRVVEGTFTTVTEGPRNAMQLLARLQKENISDDTFYTVNHKYPHEVKEGEIAAMLDAVLAYKEQTSEPTLQ